MRLHRPRTTTAAVAAALTLTVTAVSQAVPAAAHPAAHRSRDTVDIQVLNVSDLHGQLDPLSVGGVSVGGAATLSSYWAADREANPNTLLLTAGDAVGASPPLSSFFGDQPTIDFMNYAGFDADTFGNHNFDRGLAPLQAQIQAAQFPYVSANLKNVQRNLRGVDPYVIKKVGGVKVAIIGVSNPEAPTLVAPGALGSITITDPAPAAMRAREDARRHGAKVFVAIGHLGIDATDASGNPSGPLTDFARNVRGFDLILGDHTNVQYQSTINGALVLENLSKGATYAKTVLRYDRRKGGSVTATTQFVVPRADAVTPDPKVTALLQPYRDQLSTQLDGVIGTSTGIFERAGNIERIREVPLGDLTADALRSAYGTQIAFTNGGGLRSPLPSSSYLPKDTSLRRPSPGYAAGPPYDVVTGDVFSVLPFGNQSLTRTVTGAQLWAVLERSVASAPNAFGGFLQISGFRFSYDSTRPAGSRVLAVTLDDGTVVAKDSTTYTATTNDFTNAGGDGYVELKDGQGSTRNLMANDLLDYIRSQQTLTPTTDGRIDDVARADA